MTTRKTFRKLILDASFLLLEAKERLPNTESDRWHIDEALTHLAAAFEQHKQLIQKEQKESKK